MAKKSSRSFLAIIGGIIAVLGVVLSIFIKELGWWNIKTYWFGEITNYQYLSAFFGDGDPYFADTMTLLLPGIVAGVGGLLCITGNKFLSLIGSVLVIVGLVLFFVFLGDSDAAAWADFIDTSIFWDSAGGGDPYSGAKWNLGIGLFITASGGILSGIGAITTSSK